MGVDRYDLYLGELDEVRRRVADPVLAAMLRPGELVTAELVIPDDWPGMDDSWAAHRWPNDPHADRPGDEPRSLYLELRAVGSEQHSVQLGSIALYLDNARDIALSMESSLSDWICETRFGWGDARSAGDVVLPEWQSEDPERRTVEIWATEDGIPLTLDRVPAAPAEPGLSERLVNDLREWQAIYAAAAAEDARDQERFEARMAEGGFGLTVTYIDEASAALQAAAAAAAREQEHLGRWRQLLAQLEPMRDDLLERLREELGDGFYVPTPPSVP